MRLDLVLPAHNEASVLPTTVPRLWAAASDLAADHPEIDWRLLVVENGSTDDTASVAERLARELPRVGLRRLPKAGRGRALRHVWGWEDASFSLYMDVDLATDLAALRPAVVRLLAGADLVMGSRSLAPGLVRRRPGRWWMSRGYGLLSRLLLGPEAAGDLQCGFKGIRVEALRSLVAACRSAGWFFDTELVVLARHAGFRVEVLPVAWRESSRSSVVIRKAVPEVVRDLVGLRRRLRSPVALPSKPMGRSGDPA